MQRDKSRVLSALLDLSVRIKAPPWYMVFYLAAILALLEAIGRLLMGQGFAFLFGDLFLVHAFVFAALGLIIWVLPFWIVLDLIPKGHIKNLAFPVLLVLFSFSWQSSALQGEGVRGHPLFRVIQILFVLGFAAGLLGWTGFLASDFHNKVKRFFVFAITCFLMTFDYYYLSEYTAFHGHLSLFNAAMILYLVYPLFQKRARRIGALALGLSFAVILTMTWPRKREALKQFRGQVSILNGVFNALPETAILTFEFPDIIDPNRTLPEWVERELAGKHKANLEAYRIPKDAVARNVLIIVLESTRADHWADPKLAPRFHEWRRHGAYFREAISQYSATPLAYGAMFTGQSPSVMIHSPFWSRIKPFWDEIGKGLDRHILSKPDDRWFDRNTITDFLVPNSAEINKHTSAKTGLDYLKSGLETVGPDQTFLAWVHLYEPHSYYQNHKNFYFGDDKASLYKSEIAYMDHWLGEFMTWFYASGHAEHTFVVVFSDHGEGLGEIVNGRSFWRHNRVVNNFIALVPAYFSGPSIQRDRVMNHGYLSQLDVLPSIFFAMDRVPHDYYFQGRPVQWILAGDSPSFAVTEDFSYHHKGGQNVFDLIDQISTMDVEQSLGLFNKLNENQAKFSHRIGWFENGYKMVYNRAGDRYQLYNMQVDRTEQNDLAAAEPERLEAMKRSLAQWILEQCWLTRKMNEKLRERSETPGHGKESER